MKAGRAEELFERHQNALHVRTDRLMLAILLCQWVFAIILALTLSPYAWAGKTSSIHLHVQVAFFLGGLLNSLPVFLILRRPGWWFTRQIVTVSQMLWSALLIHLTGGRIETHFHVFGSLAFLAFYCDWRLLPTATIVVSIDHLVRGVFYPESVYGTANPEWWRFLEHASWVVFEDVVLVLSCLRGVEALRTTAEREALLEDLNVSLERRVEERTTELSETNGRLQESVAQLQSARRELIETSRKAGMAEIATSVLHDVGNVLNSVNVGTSMLAASVKDMKALGVVRLSEVLRQQGAALPSYLGEKGGTIAGYLDELSKAILLDQRCLMDELGTVQTNIDHLKTIVATQQSLAKPGGVVEDFRIDDLIDQAIKLSPLGDNADGIELRKELDVLPAIAADRHKTLQIVLNLLSNARHAVKAVTDGQKRITVRLKRRGEEGVAIEIEDTGCGIPSENLIKIFNHGFTTKKNGHGFGLHGSACAASEMGGDLRVHSDGPGRGARFTLELPSRPQSASP